MSHCVPLICGVCGAVHCGRGCASEDCPPNQDRARNVARKILDRWGNGEDITKLKEYCAHCNKDTIHGHP